LKFRVALILCAGLFSAAAGMADDGVRDFDFEMSLIKGRLPELELADERLADIALFLDAPARGRLSRIYEKNDAFKICVLNWIGFGIGSFVQGDSKSGYFFLGGDAIGLGVLLSGRGSSMELTLGGLGIIAGIQIASYITPFVYQGRWNRKLRSILGDRDDSFRIDAFRNDPRFCAGKGIAVPLFVGGF